MGEEAFCKRFLLLTQLKSVSLNRPPLDCHTFFWSLREQICPLFVPAGLQLSDDREPAGSPRSSLF